MVSSRHIAIWICIFAVILMQTSAFSGKSKIKKTLVELKTLANLKAREFRPSFVKRTTQAPLLHAGKEKIDDEYIVKLKDGLTDEQLEEFEEKFQALSEERGLHVDFQINITSLMKGFVARVPAAALHILRWMDEVEFVEEDEVVHKNADDTPWGLDRIDQTDLPLDGVYRSIVGDGSGVNVFVLDTGIHFTHDEFGGRARTFYDAFSDGKNGADCEGHGTHCAGTIGGRTVGVAPGVTLYSCRVLDCRGDGSFSGIVAAMDAVAGANMKPAVVSMSLSGGFSSTLNYAVQRLSGAGYIIVVAAGNNARDACNFSPASAPEAITVGATTSSDDLAYYSNYGSCVDILAPGSGVYSAYNTGDSDYYTESGTSMAAPHVAGVSALILEENSSINQDQMKNELLNAAQSNKIDLSRVPDSYRWSTPNKLLYISPTWAPPPPTLPPLDLCEDTCHYHGDGGCDDGGPGSIYDACDYGKDCSDCGARKVPITELCEDTCQYQRDGECDDGGPGAKYEACDYGKDCSDCGARIPPITDGLCENTCGYRRDGECDDGGPGSLYGYCDFGTDCADCGGRKAPITDNGLCKNTCRYKGDGECDDGGPGSEYDDCNYGTDCYDCGVRRTIRKKHLNHPTT